MLYLAVLLSFCVGVSCYEGVCVAKNCDSDLNLKSLGNNSEIRKIKNGDDLHDLTQSDFHHRKRVFLSNFPGYNLEVERIAKDELGRLQGHSYLDYTGAGVYQSSQIWAVFDDLNTSAYGNAHSRNPSAFLTDRRLTQARQNLLDFVSARSDQFHTIFTSGATGALKMVGEDFPWTAGSLFLYLRVNHNSVLGIRQE